MEPIYIKNFVSHPDAFLSLRNDLNWERRPSAPRSEYWTNTFDRPYTYGSGVGIRTYNSQPSHELIDFYRNKLSEQFEGNFEGCFLNLYEDKRDWLGWHSDDDPGIDHSCPIAVITLGHQRMINWKPKGGKGIECISQKMLEHGSLFIMPAGMQETHLHRIPKADHDTGARISMTYRCLLESYPFDYLEAEPAEDAPFVDNPSGLYCPSCRATGLSHCSSPEYCGGMRRMKTHSDTEKEN